MNKSLDFSNITNTSKLFSDFINENPEIMERFPSNGLLEDEASLKQRANNFDKREQLINAFQNSMSYIDLTEQQKNNLKSMLENNSLTIVSGQQVGFLGGPMYSIYKIITSIKRSQELNSKYSNLNFVPVFWIEDNDHDVEEAAEISLLNYKFEIKDFSRVDELTSSDRTIVAEKQFTDDIYEEINDVIENLPNTSDREHFEDILKDIYKPGKYWRESFIQLLQRWFGEHGVLFICASCLRRSGLFKELVIKELSETGMSQKLTLAANHELDTKDYHIQANSSPVNLFFHEGSERFRIDLSPNDDFLVGDKTCSKNELLEKANNNPELFSPKVLLRPIFQDAILPTAAYVAGPGETGYLAQTKEMFEFFDVPMPAVIPRHSFTLIDKKTGKFINKQELQPEYFFQSKQDIINEVAGKLLDEPLEKLFDESKNSLEKMFEEIKSKLGEVENGLINSADSALTKNLQQIDVLQKKTTSAMKRKREDLLMRYELAANYLYPKGNFQERVYSPLSFMIHTGEKQLIDILLAAAENDARKHHFIDLF